jgi:GTP-binding protein
MTKPLVAIIGQPNVGKSTLFNRLVGRRLAIVHDMPGVTRDRHYADAELRGRPYTLVDTGGFDPSGDDDMKQGIIAQLGIALEQADVVVCVLDATLAPTSTDRDEIALLRRSEKPVIYVANKADSDRRTGEAHELYRLGMEKLLLVSALHGRGFGELEDALLEALPPPDGAPAPQVDARIRVAVIGRPNAGKSSLINRLVGSERLLVDSRPGTTRDPIDIELERGGNKYLFVDTAGLRRKSKVARGRDAVEALSVMAAIRAIDRAEVVVLLCDGSDGIVDQDEKIIGLVLERGRGLVIGLNKIDLLAADDLKKVKRDARDSLAFVPWAPIAPLSAKTGRGVDRLLATVASVRRAYDQRITTGELNRFFETVLSTHPPPTQGGRAPRFYYVTQASVRPPTFVVVTSHPDHVHFSYQRYVTNALRKAFGFEGVPLVVHYRRKGRKKKKARR